MKKPLLVGTKEALSVQRRLRKKKNLFHSESAHRALIMYEKAVMLGVEDRIERLLAREARRQQEQAA